MIVEKLKVRELDFEFGPVLELELVPGQLVLELVPEPIVLVGSTASLMTLSHVVG